MIYREFTPSGQLQELVQNYWFFNALEADTVTFPLSHEVLPDATVSVVLISQPYFRGVRLLGPHTEKLQQTIHANALYFGIKLNPWVTFNPPLFRHPDILNKTAECPEAIAAYFTDCLLDFTGSAEALVATVEQKLQQLTTDFTLVQDELVRFICLELSSGKTIESVIGQLPFSKRVIQKRFKEVAGVTMQQFSGIARQRTLWIDAVKQNRSGLDLIYDCNFYDQAHFINDFKNKMKRSHTDFAAYLSKIEISLL